MSRRGVPYRLLEWNIKRGYSKLRGRRKKDCIPQKKGKEGEGKAQRELAKSLPHERTKRGEGNKHERRRKTIKFKKGGGYMQNWKLGDMGRGKKSIQTEKAKEKGGFSNSTPGNIGDAENSRKTLNYGGEIWGKKGKWKKGEKKKTLQEYGGPI